MELKESGEMYLESILALSESKNKVRSIDIVEYMNYSKPSVSRAVSKLKADNYIIVDKDGYIALTESGRKIASKIYERHNVLSSLLIALGVNEETAISDACRMEHDISDETFAAIKAHMSKFSHQSIK